MLLALFRDAIALCSQGISCPGTLLRTQSWSDPAGMVPGPPWQHGSWNHWSRSGANRGSVSISDKTSHRKISWSLKAMSLTYDIAMESDRRSCAVESSVKFQSDRTNPIQITQLKRLLDSIPHLLLKRMPGKIYPIKYAHAFVMLYLVVVIFLVPDVFICPHYLYHWGLLHWCWCILAPSVPFY